jgi:hypothetical protein
VIKETSHRRIQSARRFLDPLHHLVRVSLYQPLLGALPAISSSRQTVLSMRSTSGRPQVHRRLAISSGTGDCRDMSYSVRAGSVVRPILVGFKERAGRMT